MTFVLTSKDIPSVLLRAWLYTVVMLLLLTVPAEKSFLSEQHSRACLCQQSLLPTSAALLHTPFALLVQRARTSAVQLRGPVPPCAAHQLLSRTAPLPRHGSDRLFLFTS